MKFKTFLSVLLLCEFSAANLRASEKPHIIFILADDLGWNDVGFHGSIQIPTPNIDALAYAGVILNNYYVQPICTPSRGALLSGMHPIHTGLQHGVILGPTPYGLPLKYTLLPEYLNSLGYTSRHVGKWHLGTFKKDYTPTYRGFESHYGYWTGWIDYYDHTAFESDKYWGYDFRRNMKVEREAYGHYTTDLLTEESLKIIEHHNSSVPLFLYLSHLAVHSGNPYDPIQAPADVVKKFSYIEDENRRKFAGVMWKLDDSIGQVITALEHKGMLSNSIIIFSTDNGGAAAGYSNNAASNWPLRGVKSSTWEGGVRGAALLWSPLVNNPGRVSMEMMQIMDWLPTLYSAAGGDVADLPAMDGMNLWDSIVNESPSPRTQVLHNIDPISKGASLRVGEWKIVYNATDKGPQWDGWFGPSGRYSNESYATHNKQIKTKIITKSIAGKAIKKIMPNVFRKIKQVSEAAEVLCGPVPENATPHCTISSPPCLFHIPSDPCEYYDVSQQYPLKVEELQAILKVYNDTAVPPLDAPEDPRANPVYWNYTWTNWQDYGDDAWFTRYKIGQNFDKTIQLQNNV